MIFSSINPLNVVLTIVFCVLSYLIGSIPVGLVVGKVFKGIDLREHGSKNIGSTNSFRVLGKKLGSVVFIFDVLKGALIIILTKYILVPNGVFDSMLPFLFYGVFAVIGHVFPIYIGFKGGKAVATSLGVVLSLTPLSAVACLIVFGIVLLITGFVSVSSCMAGITVLTVSIILHFVYNNNVFFLSQVDIPTIIIYALLVLIIFIRHRQNFIRLKNHTENSIYKKREK